MKCRKWIPVKKELPKEYGEYIVTIARAKKSTVLYYSPDGDYWEDEYGNDYKVIAWMPLPERYKNEHRSK